MRLLYVARVGAWEASNGVVAGLSGIHLVHGIGVRGATDRLPAAHLQLVVVHRRRQSQ